MFKLYVFIGFLCVIAGTYWVGQRVGKTQCDVRIAEIHTESQGQVIRAMGNIDVEMAGTGVRDIRRILREKYTIAE